MSDDRAARVQQFNDNLASATDKQLLDLAELAGDRQSAVVSIAAAISMPLNEFDPGLVPIFASLILTRLFSLRNVARSNSYRWYA